MKYIALVTYTFKNETEENTKCYALSSVTKKKLAKEMEALILANFDFGGYSSVLINDVKIFKVDTSLKYDLEVIESMHKQAVERAKKRREEAWSDIQNNG